MYTWYILRSNMLRIVYIYCRHFFHFPAQLAQGFTFRTATFRTKSRGHRQEVGVFPFLVSLGTRPFQVYRAWGSQHSY